MFLWLDGKLLTGNDQDSLTWPYVRASFNSNICICQHAVIKIAFTVLGILILHIDVLSGEYPSTLKMHEILLSKRGRNGGKSNYEQIIKCHSHGTFWLLN